MPRDLHSQPQWHLIALETRREAYAMDNIAADLGLATWLPRVIEIAYHARRSYEVESPLFPGYGFAWFCEHTPGPWDRLWATRGVIGPVRIAGSLAALPAASCAALKALEGPDGKIRPKQALRSLFATGDQVRIISGAWAGFVAEVLRMRGPQRVQLMLGKLSNVEIEPERLVKV